MAADLDAEIRTRTRVTALDPADRRLMLDDGSVLEASRIALGLGADQADPGLAGDGADAVHAVNDLANYARVREALTDARRVVLIGGGLIGCEFANDWVKAGLEVTIIEPCSYPMGTMLPPAAGAQLRQALTGQGVRFVGGRAGQAVERASDGLVVHDNAGERHPADVVVRAIGLRPRTRLASEAGLDTGRGIATDRYLATSGAGIHAMGDCAEVDGVVLPFVMPINHCARALAATLTGEPTPVEYPVMPVIAKTSCCPVQLYQPPHGIDGDWSEEDLDGGTRSLFYAADGALRGFCLTGTAVREKGHWSQQVPPVFDNRAIAN
jgi:rubredoxin-NAD+ reductase